LVLADQTPSHVILSEAKDPCAKRFRRSRNSSRGKSNVMLSTPLGNEEPGGNHAMDIGLRLIARPLGVGGPTVAALNIEGNTGEGRHRDGHLVPRLRFTLKAMSSLRRSARDDTAVGDGRACGPVLVIHCSGGAMSSPRFMTTRHDMHGCATGRSGTQVVLLRQDGRQ